MPKFLATLSSVCLTSAPIFSAGACEQEKSALRAVPDSSSVRQLETLRGPSMHDDYMVAGVTTGDQAAFAAVLHILVITVHEGAEPTMTAWERRGEEWKAVRMTVNAPESMVNRVRTHFSGFPRAESSE